MSAAEKIREMIDANLRNMRQLDVVRFIDQLLPVVAEVGGIKCSLSSHQRLRFQFPDQQPFEVDLERAKPTLRCMCARLAVLTQEITGRDFNPYGDEGAFEFPFGTNQKGNWKIQVKNTPDKQEFALDLE